MLPCWNCTMFIRFHTTLKPEEISIKVFFFLSLMIISRPSSTVLTCVLLSHLSHRLSFFPSLQSFPSSLHICLTNTSSPSGSMVDRIRNMFRRDSPEKEGLKVTQREALPQYMRPRRVCVNVHVYSDSTFSCLSCKLPSLCQRRHRKWS